MSAAMTTSKLTILLTLLAPVALAACDAGGGDGDEVCVPTGNEELGNLRDDDCDGLIDEVRVCADGRAPFATLAEAVAAAPDGTGLEICAGTYRENLVLDRAIQLRGEGADLTIIDGGALGSTLEVVAAGAAVRLAELTIQGGDTDLDGGGVRCESSDLALAGVVVAGNEAAYGGGLAGHGCTIEVTGGALSGNSAGEGGGAIAILDGALSMSGTLLTGNHANGKGGALHVVGEAEVADSRFEGNSTAWAGGAIYLEGGRPTFERNAIVDNTATQEGGGLYLHQSTATLIENEITDNHAGDDGGGVRAFESAARLERNLIARNHAAVDGGGAKISHIQSTLIDNEIVDNVADAGGGGLELDNDASIVTGGTIAGNQAALGGGVHIQLAPWADGGLDGVTLTGNTAERGGGLLLEDNFQPLVLRGLVLEDNVAARGADLHMRSSIVTVTNTLFRGGAASQSGGAVYVGPPRAWNRLCPCPPALDATVDFAVIRGSSAPKGAAVFVAGAGLTVTNSVISGASGTAVTVEGAGNAPTWRYNDASPASFAGMADPTGSNGNLAVAPQWIDPDGGDFHLAAGSPCVDAGDPARNDLDGSRADLGIFGGEAAR
jgi:nitrous oxidase accessory protein NosD